MEFDDDDDLYTLLIDRNVLLVTRQQLNQPKIRFGVSRLLRENRRPCEIEKFILDQTSDLPFDAYCPEV